MSLVISEMQIKTVVLHAREVGGTHLNPPRCRATDTHVMHTKMQNRRAAFENSSAVSYKDKHPLPLRLVTPLLGVHPKEIKTNVHIIMFTPALFVIAKNRRQRECSSTGAWIDELWTTTHERKETNHG